MKNFLINKNYLIAGTMITKLGVRFLSSSLENNPSKNIEQDIKGELGIDTVVEKYKKYSPGYTSKFMEHLLNTLYIDYEDSGEKGNYIIQERIEKLIINEYDFFYSNNTKLYSRDLPYSEVLVPELIRYIISKEEQIILYIKNLKRSYTNMKSTRKDKLFMTHVLSTVDTAFLVNLCLTQYLNIYTYQDSDNENKYNILPVSISLGNKILRKYFSILKIKYMKDNDMEITYSQWLTKWELECEEFSSVLDDSFRSELGCRIIEVLTNCDMLKRVLTRSNIDKTQSILELVEERFSTKEKKERVLAMFTKLPMIVKPKHYSKSTVGGYLLNDKEYYEDLFIEKKGYGIKSQLSDNTKIYDMINRINSTPFMINRTLLDFIITKGFELNLLMDTSVKHKFSDIEKKTKYQQGIVKAYNSKVLLQENILAIAQFFAKFGQIYFPVRLDQRGRLYCSPNFFNYQSNELGKALILFANPGIIRKDNLQSISYLKTYGANCFGGIISKATTSTKLEWVDKNIENIINYENGILLTKAKDKLLFLAFCIEFKRFYNFYINDELLEFKTYLPIQLDATCNGFQHMALLSNEKTLFKELNLIDTKENEPPKDFYNFLLHKLNHTFDSKVSKGELIDPKTNGSYERLIKFVWNRTHVKKAVMTIPYNSSVWSMKDYVKSSLVLIERDKSLWYTDNEKNTENIINDKDLSLLINSIMYIIENDFRKIKKLIRYLKNIATICNLIELPITWTLPTGLTIKQSYLESKSTTITPFMYSKAKLSLKVTIKNKYDKRKQVRALMPNLIHSLDSSSLSLLFENFSSSYSNENVQFFSVHDCFGTTCDKVFRLKTILASVYTDIYSSEPYLLKFDSSILDSIESNTDYKLDRKNRTVEKHDGWVFILHDVNWVMNKTLVSSNMIKKIDSQYIVI